ncbi:oligosaccharide flippase family protein [bacterium]|nr:oligosaccharide flippase family protein [bacterium]
MAFSFRAVKLTTFANLSIQFATLLSGVLVARLLGPEGRGLYMTAILYPNIVAGLAAYGFVPMLAREAAKTNTREEGRRIIGRAVALALFQAFIGIIGLAVIIYLVGLPPDDEARRLSFIYGAAWIPCNLLGLYLVAIDQGQGAWGRHSFFRFITYPLYISLLLIFWLTGLFSLPVVLISLWSATVLSVILRVIFIFREYGFPKFDEFAYLGHLKSAFPYAGALYSTLVVTQLDGFLATVLLGKAPLGLYAVALTVAQLLNPFSKAFGLVAFTDSAKAELAGSDHQKHIFAARFRLILLGFLCMVIGMAFTMPFLIPLVYGKEFVPSVMIFFVMLPGGFSISIGTIIDERFRGKGLPQYGMKSMWVAAIASAIIAVSLVNWLGALALAAGFSVAQAARTVLLLHWFCRHEEIEFSSLVIPRIADLQQIPWRKLLRIR